MKFLGVQRNLKCWLLIGCWTSWWLMKWLILDRSLILRILERRWLESTNEFRVGDKYLCNQYYDIETMRRTLRISLRLFWLKILSRQHSEIISTFSRKLPKINLEVNWSTDIFRLCKFIGSISKISRFSTQGSFTNLLT